MCTASIEESDMTEPVKRQCPTCRPSQPCCEACAMRMRIKLESAGFEIDRYHPLSPCSEPGAGACVYVDDRYYCAFVDGDHAQSAVKFWRELSPAMKGHTLVVRTRAS